MLGKPRIEAQEIEEKGEAEAPDESCGQAGRQHHQPPRWPGPVCRRLRVRQDAHIGGVEPLLLTHLPGPHEEGLVHRTARLGLALELPKPHESEARIHGAPLEPVEIAGERVLVHQRALVVVPARLGQPRELVHDLLAGVAHLGACVDHPGMSGAELGGKIGLLAGGSGVKLAQATDRLRLHRLRGRARIDAAALRAQNLVVTGLGLAGACLRQGELVVELGELLLVHQAPLRAADDVVLALIGLDLLLGVPHALAQLVQPGGERIRCAPRRLRTRGGLLVEIGQRNVVRDARGFLRVGGLDNQVDDERALGALGADLLLQRP